MQSNQVLVPINQEGVSGRHGGSRRGAGRPKNGSDERWFRARGINPLTAAEIIEQVSDERRVWKRLLESKDDRIVLGAMMFLTSMRDGKPSQQINVTSTHLHLSASDLEKARAIVREIRGEPPASSEPRLGQSVDSKELSTGVVLDQSQDSIMLRGDEGGKKGGC